MARYKDVWLAHQRKRWMRPDAHRWFAPNYTNFLPPHERKAGFDPDQPRDEQGRWTETGTEEEVDEEEFSGDALPDEISDASRAQGHHFVARSIYRGLPLSPEARSVFDKATTGPLRAGPHGWSREHDTYNKAIREHFDRFLASPGITPETMTASHARAFVDSIKQSTDPRIRDFDLNIFRREFHYLLRFGPRRPE